MLLGAQMKKAYRPKQYRRRFEEDQQAPITHTSYALYYHLVWSVKMRFHLIDSSMIAELEDNLKRKCKELGAHMLAIGTNPEHVHCILSLKPTHCVADVVKQLKGFSSHEINKRRDRFLKWGRGYGVRTISERNLSAAIQYVKSQTEHHLRDGRR
jgi:REP element-mobilizing transposase RayT